MRIGINLLSFKEKEIAGLRIYGKNLLKNIGELDKENQFFLFTSRSFPSDLIFNYQNFHYVRLPVNPYKKLSRALFEQIIFPFYLKKYKIDVLFNLTAFHPLFPLVKDVTCVHSGGPLYFKGFSLSKIYLKLMYWTAKFSFRVITISQFAKKEILQKCKVPSEKIKVIYHGVPQIPKLNKREEKELLKRLGIKLPYFFFIGAISQTKNIKNLINAFKVINEKHPNFNLVLAGRISPNFSNIEEFVKNLGLKEKIILTGPVTDEAKSALYTNSIALVFPSFHEGFGLPVLEAQSLGVPVLTSNVTALPEIAGKGALFCNPFDVKEIAEKMEKIAFNERLKQDLIEKGFKNIKRFSWEKTAQETIKVYEKVLNENS